MGKLACVLVMVAACGSSPEQPDAAKVFLDAKVPVCGDGFLDPGELCDDGNATANDGCTACQPDPETVTANWTIKDVAGATQPCPGGFGTAAVYSQPLDATGHMVGTPFIDLFDCAAGTGTTATIPAGRYLEWVEITNATNSAQYAKSVGADVVIHQHITFSVQILTDGGYFEFVWNLTRASNGTALTCADVANLGGVESISTEVGNATNFASDIFTCADGRGITSGFIAGTYTVHVDALDKAQPPNSIGDAPDLTNRVIQAPNIVTDLGTVTIPITAL